METQTRNRSWGPELTRPGGFTLIELLVVITIIAILAAILFPVFAHARTKAHTVACASNLRQIGTALQMYASDWDGRFPERWVRWPGGSSYYWDTLDPYVRSVTLWYCPAESVHTPLLRSYGLNCYDRHPSDGRFELGCSGADASEIAEPARTICVADTDPADSREPGNPTPWDIGASDSGMWRWPITSLAESVHNGGYNALYVDGHVKWRSGLDGSDQEWALDKDGG